MNPELIKAMVKQMLTSGSRAFAISLVEESAEYFTPDELTKLVGILQRVEKKKRGTVETTGVASAAR
jgi:hypothetical protein